MEPTLVDAGKTLALFSLGAFVIDRLAKYLVLALDLMPAWRKRFAGELAPKAGELAYFVIAAILGIGLAGTVGEMRVLARLGAPIENGLLAAVINGLVLMGGADVLQTALGYLEDKRVVDVRRSTEPVEISIINRHLGPVEVQAEGAKLAGATRPVASTRAEKGPH